MGGRGDERPTRWLATNHTNPNAVYEFTPGAEVRQPWAVRSLSAVGDFPVTGGLGQAAPYTDT